MRLLIGLLSIGASVLVWRYGMGVSNPRQDSYYVLRVIGACERATTRLDAALTRAKVWLIDRLELDRVAWLKLRAQYEPSMS